MLLSTTLPWTAGLPAEPKDAQVQWPQFRGLGGQGIASEGNTYPVRFGPTSHVLWKTPVPSGNSCPCIWGTRIFLTGFVKEKNALETICLDRQTGQVLWRIAAPGVAKIEASLHPTNGPATPTAVTDGKLVYVYFGSYGLVAYDFAGKEKWHKTLPAPGNDFGSGSSPVVADNLLLLTCQGKSSCLLAVDSQTGATAWKAEKPRFGAGYATPLLRRDGAATEIILVQPRGIVAYDLKDGSERWWLGGLFGSGIPSPAWSDGMLFAVAHITGGDPDDRMKFPSFDDLLAKYDANKDGLLGQKEVPADLVFYNRGSTNPVDNITMEDMFGFIDKNRDGQLSREEWQAAEAAFAKIESALVALRPAGRGELAKNKVIWQEKRALPEVPSPLCYRGRLYVLKNGGIVSCFDAQTGKLLYRDRLGTSGFFYASLVAANGLIYASSYEGTVVVFKVGDHLEVLARNKLNENLVATPALVDGMVYVRTEGALYAFAEP
jgi:outer membrane protein assembly factor BamB